MARCPACGEENPDSARFCSACGAPLEEQRAAATRTRKTVSVVFSDVVGSTSIGERLDPEAVRAVMARYFDAMRSCLERHGGTVEKFIGDAVMAVFGIPVVHEDDALRAVRAAADMHSELADLNSDLERDWGVTIQNRTGVNTGEVVVGEVGTGSTLATGDAVNVAARLEQAANAGDVLLGELTHRLTRGSVSVGPMEEVPAKGKAEPVRAYRMLEIREIDDAGLARADLIGRDRELSALQDTFENLTREPRPRLVTIVGAAGIGKSRLAQEALRSEGSAQILRGSCLPYGEGITFWPIAQAFRQAAHVQDSDSPETARSSIAGLATDHPQEERVGELAALAAGVGIGAATAEEIAWGIRELLLNIAASEPTILLLDDIQWGEAPLLDLVTRLGEEQREASLLLLCLARPELEELRPHWADVSRVLRLDALSERDAEDLVESRMGSWGIPADARTRIADAAGGNPLFVEELVAMLIEEGILLRDKDGRWRARDLDRLEMPPTISAVLSARLERLSEPERHVARVASVIGEEFSGRAVKAIAGGDIDADEAFVGLRGRDLIVESNGDLRFRHILIRDAAYAGLPKQMRAELHERFAMWLEEDAGDRAMEIEELLGYHLEQSHRYLSELRPTTSSDAELGNRAAEHLHSAGRRALDRGDWGAAERLFERAVAIVGVDHPARPEMEMLLGEALGGRGQFRRATELLTHAITDARRSDNMGLATRADLLCSLVLLELDPEPLEDVEKKARAAIELFETAGDDTGLADAWTLLSQAAWFRVQYGPSAQYAERAIENARRAGDVAQEVRNREWLAYGVLWGPTPATVGIEMMNEELLDPMNRTLEAAFNWTLGGLLAMQGRFDEARSHVSVYGQITDELGYKLRHASSQLEGIVEDLAGDLLAAEREFLGNFRELEEMKDVGFLPTTAGLIAQNLCAQGRYEEAQGYVDRARETAAPEDRMSQWLWRSAEARIQARQGKLDSALELMDEAARMTLESDAPNDQADGEMGRAEILEIAGRVDEAVEAVQSAIALYERKENIVSATRARERLRVLMRYQDPR